MLTIAGLGIFAGCVGKSAQFPLHVWLPDAMAGPTPVSALIHAATMVAAGVYLVGRFFPLFTDDVLLYIAYTGGITLFIAATIAMVQTDYKKVLAYSTVSQLGFMMLGLGVGGWAAGLFHLITHAFFKALLFLGAGSVYHSVHTYEMPALGGLLQEDADHGATRCWSARWRSRACRSSAGSTRRTRSWPRALARVQAEPRALHALPAAGGRARCSRRSTCSGCGSWSSPASRAASPRRPRHAYAARPRRGARAATTVTAHGHGHGHGHDRNPAAHAHESEPIMTWPLVILAVMQHLRRLGTLVCHPALPFGDAAAGADARLRRAVPGARPECCITCTCMRWAPRSLIAADRASGWALLYYAPPGFPYFVPTRLQRGPDGRAVRRASTSSWSTSGTSTSCTGPCWSGRAWPSPGSAARSTSSSIDGLVNGSAAADRAAEPAGGLFDMIAVDRLVNLTAQAVYVAGDRGRSIQTGRLRNYLMFLTVALVGLFAGVFAWIRG